MRVTKTEKTLILELENEKDIYDIIADENLSWNDLMFYESNMDGWRYLYDANRNQICIMNDYGYDEINELIEKKKIEIEYKDNDEDYSNYEWNKE